MIEDGVALLGLYLLGCLVSFAMGVDFAERRIKRVLAGIARKMKFRLGLTDEQERAFAEMYDDASE